MGRNKQESVLMEDNVLMELARKEISGIPLVAVKYAISNIQEALNSGGGYDFGVLENGVIYHVPLEPTIELLKERLNTEPRKHVSKRKYIGTG